MKKTYITPTSKTVVLRDRNMILCLSNGESLQNEYNSSDVSYGRSYDFDDDESI